MKWNIAGVAAIGLIWLSGALGPVVRADVKLPAVIGSHMVLQQQRPIVIWGWADPGEAVTVALDQQTAHATADDKGDWKVTLPAIEADGKTHRMTVSGKNKIELDDILVGEVWLGSGQSNMEWPVAATQKPQEAIAAANYPQIRLFHVPKVQTPEPAKDVKADWKSCTPQTIPGFSGALYYFGLRLHKDLNVPVGLINDSWGGSPIEAWLVKGPPPGGMYNGMIAPVKPFALRGVIWYQGESNVANGLAYFGKMKALIQGWRKVWGYEFPFLFVQLAPWSGYAPGALPPLWESQVESLKIPATGMAVVTDLVDNIKDIHPQNKLDVGNRLALWALAKTYGKKDLVYSGPLFRSMAVEGNKVRLSFAHVGRGLKSRDGKPLSEFEIAGADGKFVPAEATIDGSTVVVQSNDVAAPKVVRFGWQNTANPNLMNAEGLPASPFQTNRWHGGTGE
jgi:sialate O-acetylesterase